jgi:hypothetical protein
VSNSDHLFFRLWAIIKDETQFFSLSGPLS